MTVENDSGSIAVAAMVAAAAEWAIQLMAAAAAQVIRPIAAAVAAKQTNQINSGDGEIESTVLGLAQGHNQQFQAMLRAIQNRRIRSTSPAVFGLAQGHPESTVLGHAQGQQRQRHRSNSDSNPEITSPAVFGLAQGQNQQFQAMLRAIQNGCRSIAAAAKKTNPINGDSDKTSQSHRRQRQRQRRNSSIRSMATVAATAAATAERGS